MPSPQADYRALARLALYIAGVLLAGAVLSPGLFKAAQAFVQSNPQNPVAGVLANKEFPGYFNRAAMLAAFLGLVPLLRSLKLSWRQMIGDTPFAVGWKHLMAGFVGAVAGIMIMGVICWAAGACRMKSAPGWDNWLLPLASGLSVATIEEMLFRGAILGILCHSLGQQRGLYWTTGLFALVHFLKPPVDGAITADQVTWSSGFWVITQLFRGFGQWQNFIGEFLLLAVVGYVLARARQDTRGLWLSIGLHAGWVAGMKYFSQLINTTPALRNGEFTPWMVRNTCRSIVSPIVGAVPVVVVFLTGLLVLWLIHRSQRREPEKAVANNPN